jgi:hypothetical protein
LRRWNAALSLKGAEADVAMEIADVAIPNSYI